jgi:hypothetical protein
VFHLDLDGNHAPHLWLVNPVFFAVDECHVHLWLCSWVRFRFMGHWVRRWCTRLGAKTSWLHCEFTEKVTDCKFCNSNHPLCEPCCMCVFGHISICASFERVFHIFRAFPLSQTLFLRPRCQQMGRPCDRSRKHRYCAKIISISGFWRATAWINRRLWRSFSWCEASYAQHLFTKGFIHYPPTYCVAPQTWISRSVDCRDLFSKCIYVKFQQKVCMQVASAAKCPFQEA